MNSLLALLAGLLAVGAMGAGGGGGGSGSGGTGLSGSRRDDDEDDWTVGSWEGLSAEEQLMVELINRARMDPNAEADLYSIPLRDSGTPAAEPLAAVATLSEAAERHSEDMLERDYFAHHTPEGLTPTDRAAALGYTHGVGENISWVGNSTLGFDFQLMAEYHHELLWGSDTGHQENLLWNYYNVIGVGYAYGSFQNGGTVYNGSTMNTNNFANDGESYLTGVVIDDLDGDAFYDIGEGQGGVTITATNDTGTFSTATWDAGGYSLALAPGTYTVVFEGGELDGRFETTVTIGSENVKVDVIEGVDTGASSTLTLSAPPEITEPSATMALAYPGTEDLYQGDIVEEAQHAGAFQTMVEVLEAGDASQPGEAGIVPIDAGRIIEELMVESSIFDSTVPYEEEAYEDEVAAL